MLTITNLPTFIISILRRLANLTVTLIGASVLVFVLIRLAPGDPVAIMFGPTSGILAEERLDELREEMGLNQPLPVQYLKWLRRVILFDFGISFRTRRPVAVELLGRLPATMILAGLAFLVQISLVVPLGILSATRANTLVGHATRLTAVVLVATPSFWMGYLLLFVFSVRLHWVAVSATISIKQVILPALTLGMVTSPLPMRVLRASLLDEFSRMYVLVAQAKGFSKHYVLVHHVLPNAILPVMTLLALSFSGLLTGSVIIESVFVWPGMGKYLVDSIYARDYPVIQGYALLTTAIVVFVNLLVDHLYTIIDPRIRL